MYNYIYLTIYSTFQRAGGSTTKSILTNAWNGVSVYYDVASLDQFTHEDLKDRLLQCGGSNYIIYIYNLDILSNISIVVL